jgi:hypothetical protein
METPTITISLPDGMCVLSYDRGRHAARLSATLQDGTTTYNFNTAITRDEEELLWDLSWLRLEISFPNKWGSRDRRTMSVSKKRRRWLREQLEAACVFEIMDEHPQYLEAGAKIEAITQHDRMEQRVAQVRRRQQWALQQLESLKQSHAKSLELQAARIKEATALVATEEAALAALSDPESIALIELTNLQF